MDRFLFCATLFSVILAAEPGDIIGERFRSKTTISWDAVTQDIQGNPETIGSYEVAFALSPTDVRTGGNPISTVMVAPTVTSLSIEQSIIAMSIAEGATLRMWVRAYDQAGNVSGWSNMLEGVVDNLPPKEPKNNRVGKR